MVFQWLLQVNVFKYIKDVTKMHSEISSLYIGLNTHWKISQPERSTGQGKKGRTGVVYLRQLTVNIHRFPGHGLLVKRGTHTHTTQALYNLLTVSVYWWTWQNKPQGTADYMVHYTFITWWIKWWLKGIVSRELHIWNTRAGLYSCCYGPKKLYNYIDEVAGLTRRNLFTNYKTRHSSRWCGRTQHQGHYIMMTGMEVNSKLTHSEGFDICKVTSVRDEMTAGLATRVSVIQYSWMLSLL